MRHGGRHLLVDLDKSKLLRISAEPIRDDQLALRSVFERHVASVAWQLGPNRNSLVEDFCLGTTLSSLPREEQIKHARTILCSLAELVDSKQPQNLCVEHHEVFEKSIIWGVRDHASQIAALLGADCAASVPVHGDLGLHNVLVNAEGLPVVIDLDALRRGLFWEDAVRVATDCRQAWEAGELDLEMGRIWEAAGLSPVKWDPANVRLARLGAFAVDADKRLREAGAPRKSVSRKVAELKVRTRWSKVSKVLVDAAIE